VDAHDRGAMDFLQQAHRNNWRQYVDALRAPSRRGWDLCILTAGDDRQSALYRRQLDWRREAGLLPAQTEFRVVADPEGLRVGSGGATLRALPHASAFRRTLVIHSGGDSKRLPHCSATGKLFARVPRVLPDGRASTIFDEFLITLSGLAAELPPGVLIASGDVLLVFDHLQLTFLRSGVIGVAAAAPAEMGLRHGVYVSTPSGHRVRAYLHKPSRSELARWEAVQAGDTVQIDTGLVWFDAPTAGVLAGLAQESTVGATALNLYGDLLLPLAESTTLAGYMADTSDGPATPAMRAAREAIWASLRGTPFSVERLEPAIFLHFGTSYEYWQMVANDPELARTCGWSCSSASWPERESSPEAKLVSVNSVVEGVLQEGAHPVLLADCWLRGATAWQGPAIVAGLVTDQPLTLEGALVVHQLPVSGVANAGSGFVTRIFGLHDDPKRNWGDPGATFLNRPWTEWLTGAGIPGEVLWPQTDPEERTLWNARLYPVFTDREESLRWAMPLLNPGCATESWRRLWESATRLSLAESFALADGARLLAELVEIEDQVAVRGFCSGVEAELPAGELHAVLGVVGSQVARRSKLAGSYFEASVPLLRLRGYKSLAVAAGDTIWEDRAFATLAEMIEGAPPKVAVSHMPRVVRHPGGRAVVKVSAAARIDFGGGWTDTPPHSIERGGTVLNAAVTLHGTHPVVAEARWLPERELVLECRDVESTLRPAFAGEVLAYANPADPFALHKAALVLRGVVPRGTDRQTPIDELLRPWGAGLWLSTGTNIPRGSGLGTSSIMAGAILTSLQQLLAGENRGLEELFDEVLCLEQMMTTGGGWQDQVGGLTGGVKLATSRPGLPQTIAITALEIAPPVAAELAQRLVLVYTGQQRLAKNLLRAVMARWMARDPEMVWILGEIGRLALAMQAALWQGDLDHFGELLNEHWALNKRMDPGCSNPFIDKLIEIMTPYISGAKLAGAGGGGFAIVVACDADAVLELGASLATHFPGTRVGIWPCAVPAAGLEIQLVGP